MEFSVSDMRRRHFLAALAALSARAFVAPVRAAAQSGVSATRRIDVHAHFATPAWSRKVAATPKGLNRVWNGWTPAKSLEYMDRGGVATSLVSITMPGVWFGNDDEARRLARDCNEFGAKMVADYRGRFGLFAALPLPDIQGSLREIEYAFDTLKAEGVGLLTNHGDRWLGDPHFAPVFEELNRRKAVVYTHPTVASCCYSLVEGVSEQAIEYGTDTTRAIASLLVSGAAAKYTDLRFIFSHAGGTMPFLIHRFKGLEGVSKQALPNGPVHELQKFYYDTAQAYDSAPMAALRKVVPISQILFGTDNPYSNVEDDVKGLQESEIFSAADLRAIGRDNALKLFPKYRT
jgi:predicted TIM-barrel fold metal-dependent hydrolase